MDACTTRLRLQVVDNAKVDEAALKALGSRGLIKPAAGSVQVVLGPEADLISDEIRIALKESAAVADGAAPAVVVSSVKAVASSGQRNDWLQALGGAANVKHVEAVAGSRLRVEVADASLVDEQALHALGARGVTTFSGNLLHVVLAEDPAPFASLLQA